MRRRQIRGFILFHVRAGGCAVEYSSVTPLWLASTRNLVLRAAPRLAVGHKKLYYPQRAEA
jgi:hypothetical protein